MKNQSKPMSALMLSALGIVFGDIGTSPLYTFRECLKAVPLSPESVLGVLSMILWSVFVVVTLKYVFFVMRADNNGEGGILSLMALVGKEGPAKLKYTLTLLGLFGAAMFYGDSMVTPAISVLSAVEGLELISPQFKTFVVPIALVILSVLFAIQKQGTAQIGKYFGPTMLAWFGVLALIGVAQIAHNPMVVKAISPMYGINFVMQAPGIAFIVLSSVFLALTGGEALYADMGHFGKEPIQKVWLLAVFPALMLNYFGQGALVLAHPEAAANPFFGMVPTWGLIPLVLLSGAATVIASQAVISGAFSMTKQGIHMGYLPRLTVIQTSYKEIGQIFVPFINKVLFVAVCFLVLFFRSSDNLAAAYGIAVSSTMLLTTVFMLLVTKYLWKWSNARCYAITGCLLCVDAVFVATNLGKVMEGGWFPIAIGLLIFTLMTTWKSGRVLLLKNAASSNLSLQEVVTGLCGPGDTPQRVQGTAVFMNSMVGVTPSSFMHNLKHNKVIHDTNIFLSLVPQTVPFVKNTEKISIVDLGFGFYQVIARVGFKESSNVPKLLLLAQNHLPDWTYDVMDVSFFLTRETITSSKGVHGMAVWREKLFAVLSRNAATAANYFHLPSNRVVELGGQVSL